MNSKGISIPDNLVAFLLFSISFVYIVSVMSGYISPYLEREEYGQVAMEGYTALEKIISDPSVGIVTRDHVLNYDQLVELRADPDSYEKLKENLNVRNDFVIEIASNIFTADTVGVVGSDEVNATPPIVPPEEYDWETTPLKYTVLPVTIGGEEYEVMSVPKEVDGEWVYWKVYIDTNKNRDFQDEVDRGFYGYEDGTPRSGFIEGDIFQIQQAPTRIESLRIVGIDPRGYKVYFLNKKAVDIWIGDPSMVKYFPDEGKEVPTGGSIIAVYTRLVLVEQNGELQEKRLIFTMRD